MRLGELIQIVGGGTPDRSVSEYWGGEVNWISVKDFTTDRIFSSLETITVKGLENSSAKLIPMGNVIIPTRMALGKVAINFIDVAINQDLKALIIKDKTKLDPQYLFYYMKSKSDYIESRGKGATVKGITIDIISNLEIPLPSLHIQKKIAQVLDKADSLIQKRKQAIAKLDELVQSVFLEIFGDPGNFKDATFLLEQVCEINPSLKDFKCNIDTENSFVTFVPMEHVQTDGKVVVQELRHFKEVSKGYTFFTNKDVLCAKITPCFENGKIGLVNQMSTKIGFGSTEFHVLRAIDGVTVPEYLCYLLRTLSIRRYLEKNMTGSAGQKRVPTKVLKNMKVKLPPYSLQQRFASFVQEIQSQKSIMQQQLTKLEENFHSLLQRAFKGELELSQVGEWDAIQC